MNQPAGNPASETAFQKERRILREHLPRLGNSILNRLFDLKPKSAHRRMNRLVFLLILAGLLIGLKAHPLTEWARTLQACFSYLFNPLYDSRYTGNPFFNLIWLGIQTYINPYTLQHLPIFLIPFFIAQQAAAFYLADIFELQNIGIARMFIRQVALTGSEETVRITAGEVSAEHRELTIYQIGGPGKVIVDLDSVALFEKADGQPHVIGPTGKEPGGKATLEGFERFRQALDLRDHYIDLRDQDDKSPSVKGRSLDGIPVTATDVRMMFSVHRDGQKPMPELPYPFTREAIEQLIYKSTAKVTPDQKDPSQYQFIWMGTIPGMVRSELGGFISQKKLIEFLASIGLPELEKARKQEKAVEEEAKQALPPGESPTPSESHIPPTPPPFTPRYQISNLFSQFTKKFTDGAREKGVELHWIGVGTWKVPEEIIPSTKVVPEQHKVVPEQHLEAWKINRENIGKGSKEAMESAAREAELQKTLSLIQSVPLSAYHDVISKYPVNHDDAVKAFLLEYQKLLKDRFELLHKSKQRIPPTLVAAIFFIDRLFAHRVYPPPPPPATVNEAELYAQLLTKIGMPEVIEKLVELEGEFDPQASREELLERLGREWDKDISEQPRPSSPTGPAEPPPPAAGPQAPGSGMGARQSVENLREELIGLVGGDRATAERLIEFERRRFPDASLAELIKRAIERLHRDRQ